MAQRIGCLGGGQLGRMLALAGLPLGLRFTFLEPAEDACAGALGELIAAAYGDPRGLEELAQRSDLVTFEFESVPEAAASALESKVSIWPPPAALAVAQDRLLEKRLFAELGIPTALYAVVGRSEDLPTALEKVGLPARLKTRRLGYDGHGQRLLRAPDDLAAAWRDLREVPSILERVVSFDRELSVVAVRSQDGRVATYPAVENHHRSGVLRLTLAPAPKLLPEVGYAAAAHARAILDHFAYVGVLALELFQVGGQLLANEIAPRVHNSGHWTIEGAACSQFENHLRAGLGWALGETTARGCSAMVNLIGTHPDPARLAGLPLAHPHLYGKAPRPGRKLGHV
ncbi:MAG: 5-(carboxyamino)imidazole ribonucleotide synthase, partial [Candidatus Dormibacteria bacterium]